MRAGWCTLGELNTSLSMTDVADAHDFLVANEEAEAEQRRIQEAKRSNR